MSRRSPSSPQIAAVDATQRPVDDSKSLGFLHVCHGIRRCVVLPSVMAARCVVQCLHLANATDLLTPVLWPTGGSKLQSYFSCFWTNVHRVKFVCAGVSVACNAVFRLTMSCCVPETVAIKLSKITPKLDVFGPPNFGGRGSPNVWPNFINLGHHRTCDKVW